MLFISEINKWQITLRDVNPLDSSQLQIMDANPDHDITTGMT
jgi:hypothetical protein